MKKKIVNVVISILFSVTLVLTIVSLTVLNKNFIMRVVKNKGYVLEITNNINEDLMRENIDYQVKISDVEEYLNTYVKSRYKYEKKKYESIASDVINEHILFMGNRNYKMYSYIIYLITLISIVITGNVFLKSKRVHDLASIFILSFFELLIIYGMIYFKIDRLGYIIKDIVNILNHIRLGTGIILLEIGVYKKRRFKKLS
ncbi:MAG: hypothetical protein K2I70_05305 [Bacilli bacterium]|nr:hypothetical protein [Bacilli bacterium]